jgi:methylmalonyl-CoA/ethylmalonyl-CoA epimerase
MQFNGLDHLAIVVPDTEAALRIWRDRFGFPVLFSERVNNETALLTHLDLGNTHLQLVEPLVDDSPLWEWMRVHGPGLHHFCLAVGDTEAALAETAALGLPPAQDRPHQGTRGKRALFIDTPAPEGVLVELAGD